MGMALTELNRTSLTQLANSISFDKAEVRRDLEHLSAVRALPTPLSINPAFQTELQKICSIHQRLIQRAIDNIRTQHSVRTLFHMRLEHELSFDPLDLEALDQMVKEKLGEINAFRDDLHEICVARGMLINRITTLTSIPNPGQPMPGLWDIIGIHVG
jgi:hypothetical protein